MWIAQEWVGNLIHFINVKIMYKDYIRPSLYGEKKLF